jgi:SNF2 family DNA or RNA helicase
VVFHGGVAGEKRKALLDRFREDTGCRAFLSTDAGGVGLNLQHASVVVNVDLPWNPAILEQRIGRVHRLGQTRPVQVVNLVSKGTIE